jgi:hypothetical protein
MRMTNRICGTLVAFVLLPALMCCSTAPPAPSDPVLTGVTQNLVVRTDPPGAACSIMQRGEVVATVHSTPGAASVPRNFRTYLGDPRPAPAELVIVCQKEGYLLYRASFPVALARDVWREEQPQHELSPPEAAAGFIVGAAAVGGFIVLSPVIVPLQGAGSLVGLAAMAAGAIPHNIDYAYRALPEFLLVPATFDSEAACDAFFATVKTRLEAARDARRALVDAECRFYPCQRSDPTPCPDLVCERQRNRADAQLANDLSQLPALRAQVRIIAKPE